MTLVRYLLSQSSPFGFDFKSQRRFELGVDIGVLGRPERKGDGVVARVSQDSSWNWIENLRSILSVSLSELPSIAEDEEMRKGRDEKRLDKVSNPHDDEGERESNEEAQVLTRRVERDSFR